jgi:hypothetical protein
LKAWSSACLAPPVGIYTANTMSERGRPGTHEVGGALPVEGATQAPVIDRIDGILGLISERNSVPASGGNHISVNLPYD